jgi:hypothetical protein
MKRLSTAHQNLLRRYLLWAYKTTRESFERIERKTTQLMADEYILDYFSKHRLPIPAEFKAYVAAKRKDELKLKFSDGNKKKLHPQYVYLKNRLNATEAAVRYFLGGKELKRMTKLFEEEFTRRILEARDH